MRLRELIESEELIVAPGAYDVISAQIIEKSGFPIVYITGLGNEASDLGYPDLGLTTAAEIVRRATNVVSVVKSPVVCDADTGFGGALNLHRTIRMFEAAGVSGVHIEDQTFPKRCGAVPGKQVIAAEQFASRIRAAVDARTNRDFVLIARTDSKISGGVSEAVRRLNLYVENGADMAMVGDFYRYEDYVRLVKEVKAPMVVCASDPAHFAYQPDITLEQWKKAGVKMVLYWYLPLFAAMKAVERAVGSLRDTGSVTPVASALSTYGDYENVVEMKRWLKVSETFD